MMTHIAVLRILADGELHSGQAIAGRLGLSRNAVWKALNKLATELGIEVLAERGRGYRLVESLQLLDAARIRAALPVVAQRMIDKIEVHTSLASTNTHLMELARAGAPCGRICLSEHQQCGRGRHGRTWVSPFGCGILLSVLWRFDFGPAAISGLSLAAGAVVAKALQDFGLSGIMLKWPNDLLWQDRKLAGLLLEVAGEAQGPSHVVVGLGLNLRLAGGQGGQIDQPWVDLETALGAELPDRNQLAAALIVALISAMDDFARDGLAPFLSLWEGFDRYQGRPITLVVGDRTIPGVHVGIDESGALRVRTDAGEQRFQAGEVSLRLGADTRC